jgi:hypothetical protein
VRIPEHISATIEVYEVPIGSSLIYTMALHDPRAHGVYGLRSASPIVCPIMSLHTEETRVIRLSIDDIIAEFLRDRDIFEWVDHIL